MHVKEIPSKVTLNLRREVLRPGQGLPSCIFEGDDLSTTKHFGVFSNENKLLGIASIFYKDNPSIQCKNIFQLRGMASIQDVRGQGVGSLLLSAAENYVRDQGSNLIWANARTSAIGFYTKLGYSLISGGFYIDGVGTHYLVSKYLR